MTYLMKYICPKRCTVNDEGGICPHCGMSMKTFGRVGVEETKQKLMEDQLERKGNYDKPFTLKTIA